MLADEERRVGSVGTPAHGAVEKLLVLETGKEGGNGFADCGLGGVRVRVRGVFCVRAWDGDEFRGGGAEGLMLLEAGEAGELVAYLYDAVPGYC